MVTLEYMVSALKTLGVCEGDRVLVHSSFKSLGQVEDGANTVVSALKKAVGDSGTVIFPTFCQKDFTHVYETWHLDKHSDVGYLTNYFRKLPEALRSNQATHSVAAVGKDAAYLTETHGETGLRFGPYGDTAFSVDSPWEKMVQMNTKVIFLGVTLRCCTLRHYAEYCYIEQCLEKLKGRPDYEELKAGLWCFEEYEKLGPWPDIRNDSMQKLLADAGKLSVARCGDAELLMVSAQDFVNTAMEQLRENPLEIMIDRQKEPFMNWLYTAGLGKKES